MPLVNVQEIYAHARLNGYGVAGFCAENLDMVLAILHAVDETSSPVVIVLWEADILSVGEGYLESIVRFGASQVGIPVGLMLDHGSDFDICMRCIKHGHSAVMIDASHQSYDENIRITRQVCEAAHPLGVLVESELGTIRRSFESAGPYASESVLTDPAMVAGFVQASRVDSLAISIGSESGIPSKPPRLDFNRLKQIAAQTDAYLVIHGGSGLSSQDIQRAVAGGVTAFRFASELRIDYLQALDSAYHSVPGDYPDTRKIFEPARAAAQARIVEKLKSLGCVERAW